MADGQHQASNPPSYSQRHEDDLGDYAEDGGDGFKLVLWMAEHDRWPSQGIRIHSALVTYTGAVLLANTTLISPSAGLIAWTIVSIAVFALIGWIVLAVAPRHFSAFVGRWAKRRWPS